MARHDTDQRSSYPPKMDSGTCQHNEFSSSESNTHAGYVPAAACGGRLDRSVAGKIQALARQRKARHTLAAMLMLIAALSVTALLAVPHLTQSPEPAVTEPVVTVQPTPTPLPEPSQLADPCLVLVNEDNPIPAGFQLSPRTYGGVTVSSLIFEDLCALLDAARAEDCVLWLASGYRSVEEQSDILERAVENRMQSGLSREAAYENARLTMQAPGFSEHHTGLAIDFNEVNYAFEDTGEYRWLEAHAAEYGFVQRYPADKAAVTGIDYEPWHYRYVGREHAKVMQELNMCLEEYAAYLRAGGVLSIAE